MARKYYKSDNRRKFYKNRIKAQDGKCAICQRPDRLVIDHDHKTGLMRGLLCYRHNTALGLFEDDPALLRLAALYLENNKPIAYREVKKPTSVYANYLASQEILPQLLADDSFPSDRARARFLAEQLGCAETTAHTRVRRARAKLAKTTQGEPEIGRSSAIPG